MLRRTAAILMRPLFSIVLVVGAAAAPHTVIGTVTDTMCGKKHMIPGKSGAECTQVCMKSKGGWTYGLVVGDKVLTLAGDNKQIEPLAGKRVKVTGDMAGAKVTVVSIAEER